MVLHESHLISMSFVRLKSDKNNRKKIIRNFSSSRARLNEESRKKLRDIRRGNQTSIIPLGFGTIIANKVLRK